MAQIGVHGAVGGVMSVLQGGKFGNGFVSAGIGKGFTLGGAAMGLGDVGNFALTTIAGGTASVATGGKFANGAQTAALAFLVNHVATKGIERTKELGERMSKLQAMSLDKDGANSETYKDISKMKMTYDPKLKSVAIMDDGENGVGRVGDGFFKLDSLLL
ncbi:MAG: hypothetical protein U5M23_06375 [Marinagarivorans sp.]|nr:hypothetical protein [Marinagarivorans sp.]